MICKQCGKRALTINGLCQTCMTVFDLRKAGYTEEEIKSLMRLMEESLSAVEQPSYS